MKKGDPQKSYILQQVTVSPHYHREVQELQVPVATKT